MGLGFDSLTAKSVPSKNTKKKKKKKNIENLKKKKKKKKKKKAEKMASFLEMLNLLSPASSDKIMEEEGYSTHRVWCYLSTPVVRRQMDASLNKTGNIMNAYYL